MIYNEAYFTKKTSKGSTSKNFSKDKFKCNFCGKPRHFEKDCFIKASADMIQDNVEEEPTDGEATAHEEANLVDVQDLTF